MAELFSGVLARALAAAFLIPAAITGFMVMGGVSGYKKYKMGRYRMSTGSMTSYTNDREDMT